MYEIPIKYVFRGDRHAGRAFMRRGAVLMGMLENFMSYRGLKQCVMRRGLSPDVRIECDCRFGLRTVTITVASGAGAVKGFLRDCFANNTVALAYVLDVAMLKEEDLPPGAEREPPQYEPYGGEISAEEANYPRGLYCTQDIRYTVAVCDGRGEYVLFQLSKAASTDYTPHHPGDQILVMQHRTSDLPESIVNAADAAPYGKKYFTYPLAAFPDECVSILPFPISMPKVNETEM